MSGLVMSDEAQDFIADRLSASQGHPDEIWQYKHTICLVITEACTIQFVDYVPLNMRLWRGGMFI